MSVTVTYDDGAPEIICAPATNAAELTFADTPLVTARCSNVVPFCPDQWTIRTNVASNPFSNRTVHTSAGPGPHMTFAFRGTAVRFYSTVNAFPNCVNVLYTLDDKSTVAQQCDSSRPAAYNVQVFEASGLDPTVSHTLVAQAAPLATENLGKRMYFDVDRIEVDSPAELPTIASSPPIFSSMAPSPGALDSDAVSMSAITTSTPLVTKPASTSLAQWSGLAWGSTIASSAPASTGPSKGAPSILIVAIVGPTFVVGCAGLLLLILCGRYRRMRWGGGRPSMLRMIGCGRATASISTTISREETFFEDRKSYLSSSATHRPSETAVGPQRSVVDSLFAPTATATTTSDASRPPCDRSSVSTSTHDKQWYRSEFAVGSSAF